MTLLSLPTLDLDLANPSASNFTQRWKRHKHSWRHVSEGGFASREYEVGALDEAVARAFVEQHHYSGSYSGDLQRYGLWHHARLVGVAVLGNGGFSRVLTNPFPDLEPYSESAELSRFVLLDEVPGNAESWFLAEAFRQAAALGMRGIVSFSDPQPRTTAAGHLVMRGHVGTIYQASNATYTGRATSRTIYLLPDGRVFNEQSLGKIRLQKQGARYAEAELVRFGARPREDGEDPRSWLRQALVDAGCRRVRHPGNHRYLFTLANPRLSVRQQRRARASLRATLPESLSYPKNTEPIPLLRPLPAVRQEPEPALVA